MGSLFNKKDRQNKKIERIKNELQWLYGYSKKELDKMNLNELEDLLDEEELILMEETMDD